MVFVRHSHGHGAHHSQHSQVSPPPSPAAHHVSMGRFRHEQIVDMHARVSVCTCTARLMLSAMRACAGTRVRGVYWPCATTAATRMSQTSTVNGLKRKSTRSSYVIPEVAAYLASTEAAGARSRSGEHGADIRHHACMAAWQTQRTHAAVHGVAKGAS